MKDVFGWNWRKLMDEKEIKEAALDCIMDTAWDMSADEYRYMLGYIRGIGDLLDSIHKGSAKESEMKE